MVFSQYFKLCILYLRKLRYSPAVIAHTLNKVGLRASLRGVAKFLKRFQETGKGSDFYRLLEQNVHSPTGGIGRVPGRRKRSAFTEEMKTIVKQQMHSDDKTTASQFHFILTR